MALHTVGINVLDFDETDGTPPHSARLEVSRAQVSAVSGTLVTTRPVVIPLTAGVGTTQLEGLDYYVLLFRGCQGLERAFTIQMPDTDTDAATLWASHQIDPTTLQPAVVPASTQQLLDDLATTAAALEAVSVVATAHAGDDDLVDLTFPSQLLDPTDTDLVTLTIGGS